MTLFWFPEQTCAKKNGLPYRMKGNPAVSPSLRSVAFRLHLTVDLAFSSTTKYYDKEKLTFWMTGKNRQF